MSLGDELRREGRPIGYLSFLTALVHHGVLIDGIASVQVASLDRAGPWEVQGRRLEYHLLPRDLWFGHEETLFEGERLPLATPEKALLDWCWLAEESGLYPRLDEMEWAELDLGRLDLLAAAMGISYRRLLAPAPASHHDQERSRADALARIR